MASQNSDKIMFWRGTRFVFERKIQRGELVTGTVYFVGNSMEDVEGTGQSTYGVIYQAVSESKAVRYGIFATDDDITRLIEELTEKIDEEGEERREADDQLSERIAHLIPEVADAVENHMAIFDSDGRLKDSGRDIVEFLMDGDIDDATIKFENGKLVVQNYSHRHHVSDIDGLRTELDTKMGNEMLGTSNGIATLDENAKLKTEQLPYTSGDGISIEGNTISNTHTNITDSEINDICVTSETETPARNEHFLDNWGLKKLWDKIKNFFVQKETGKGLSSNDYTDAEKTKLAGIESGAEVNVQSDWNQTDNTADDYIKNKPSVYTKTETDNKLADKQNTLTFDTTPTANSTNPVTSGGIKTALDAKQDEITVTTNTTDPNDNDTIIMQASGVSNTTTFLRRTMSKIWDYIKGKADSIYVDYAQSTYVNQSLMDFDRRILRPENNDILYAADKRWTVTYKNYDAQTDELLGDYSESDKNKPFLHSAWFSRNHSLEGTYSLLRIGDGTSNLNLTSSNNRLMFAISYYYTFYPTVTPTVKVLSGNSLESATWKTYTGKRRKYASDSQYIDIFINNVNNISNTYCIEVRIDGRNIQDGNVTRGVVIGRLECYNYKRPLESKMCGVTKLAIKQDLYGEVEAPKFIKRGGTSQQVLLANGTTINMPSTTGTNKDTLLKNLTSGLSNGTSDVTDTTEIVTSYAGANGFNTTSYINVPYKRQAVKMWNYILGKINTVLGIDENTASDIAKKANRVIDHTWNQPSYSASASGTHVKICDIPSDCVCVMNVRKSVYGYPSINTLWIGNNNSLDFKSLTETDIVATVSSRICTLSVPAHTASGTPLHTYDFEISVLNKDDLSSITWYDTATYYSPSRPTKPNIVMQQSAPVTDGSLSFNVNSSTHVASVSVDGYTDFVGMMTSDSESAVLVKLSDEEEGSVYRFTFDHAIEGGVSFSNSNASTVYCEVSQVIHAGDTITLTAVSNTADGWIASVSSAGIISSDNSVNIEWENGVADLKVERIPANIVLNRSEVGWENDRILSIGMDAQAQNYSGDESAKYAYTDIGRLSQFKVDGGSNEYYHEVTAGTTYSINRSGTVVSYTPSVSGYVIICVLSRYSSVRYDFSDNNHKWVIKTDNNSVSTILEDTVISGNNSYIIGVISASSSSVSQFGDQSTVRYWEKYSARQTENIAICAYATGKNTIAIGSPSYGSDSITIGKNGAESQRYCIVMGYSAKASAESAVLIGNNAKTNASDAVAIGNMSEVGGRYSMAIGQSAKVPSVYALAVGNSASANGGFSVAIGVQAKTTDSNSIAIGAYSNANRGIAIGRSSNAAYASGDSNLPYYKAKRFTAVEFTVSGDTKLVIRGTYGVDVTISVNGTQKTVTPPSSSQLMLCVVNDSSASVMGKFVSDYPTADGRVAYCPNMVASSVSVDNITGNYYAVWFRCDNNQSYIDVLVNASTFSFLAYYKTNSTSYENFAIGYESYALCNGIAIGRGAVAIRDSQIVIGNYSIPDEDAMLIIGNGISGNNRKNILTIDDKEIVHARAYISDPQTYDTGGNSVNLGTITMGILKVTGGGAITFTNQNAVEGHCVKVYASGNDITCNGETITAGKWREYLFLDGAWHSQM